MFIPKSLFIPSISIHKIYYDGEFQLFKK